MRTSASAKEVNSGGPAAIRRTNKKAADPNAGGIAVYSSTTRTRLISANVVTIDII